jgi:hypothetical protein
MMFRNPGSLFAGGNRCVCKIVIHGRLTRQLQILTTHYHTSSLISLILLEDWFSDSLIILP